MVLLHLVAKPEKAEALCAALAELGLKEIRPLPGGRVLLQASPGELEERLGLPLRPVSHERRVGPLETEEGGWALADSARLTHPIAELVERFYLPTPPDRLEERR